MSYNTLLQFITEKGGAGSGNFAHPGRVGKVGGSQTIGVPMGLVPGLPGGSYNAVYSSVYNKQTALTRAGKLGPGHVVVRIAGKYHVINTNNPAIQAPGIHYSTPGGAKIAAGVTAYWQGQGGPGGMPATAGAAPAPAAPVKKTYGSKVEEHYDNATPEAKEFANKYGMLAQDAEALKYLKAMEATGALKNREVTHSADNQQYKNRQMVDKSFDGRTHETQSKALRGRSAAGLDATHVSKRLEDPLGRGDDGYVIIPKGTKVKDLPYPDIQQPDFDRMASLKSQSAQEVGRHQSHMDKNWNMYDNGQIKAKIHNAFEITMPGDLHDTYQAKKAAKGNTKFLYHGTDSLGASGIAKNGYFRGDVAKIGRIHGNGIYLADQASKSVQYAHSHSGSKMTDSRGVVIINQAALGKMFESSDDYSARVAGTDDLRGDIDSFKKLPYSWGSGSNDPFKSEGHSHEYIVPDPGAIQPRIWLDITRTTR